MFASSAPTGATTRRELHLVELRASPVYRDIQDPLKLRLSHCHNSEGERANLCRGVARILRVDLELVTVDLGFSTPYLTSTTFR